MNFRASQINGILEFLSQARPLAGSNCQIKQTVDGYLINALTARAPIIHPWMTTAQWDSVGKNWKITVRAGFINGIDPTVSVFDPKTKILVPFGLTDFPELIANKFQDLTAADATVKIPEFFKNLGAMKDTSFETNQNTGSIAQKDNPVSRRRLLSVDIYVAMARAAVNGTLQVENNVVSYVPTFNVSALRRYGTRGRVLVTDNLKTQQQVSAAERILAALQGEGSVDTSEDQILICTGYFLSPASTEETVQPDGSWSFYASHQVFYNMLYASQNVVDTVKPLPPIPVYTGPYSDFVNSVTSSGNNNVSSSAQAAIDKELMSVKTAGKFWTC